jgi:23S rRNA (uracil1939-C5)-methyltransferase
MATSANLTAVPNLLTYGRIVAVSCEPKTFARDAKILIDGGYRLVQVTPVDQFAFSTHVELVGVFQR